MQSSYDAFRVITARSRSSSLILFSLGDMEPLFKAHEVAARLRKKYGATVSETDRSMQISFPDVPQAFELSADEELTLFTDSWHEHFDSIESLEAFLDGLFTGRLQVIVTYRGNSPVAHRVVARRDGETRVLSRTGVLVPLLWRRKSQRTLTYEKPGDGANGGPLYAYS